MKWDDFRESENVEDRRGRRVARGGKLGLGTVVILGALGWYLGIDPQLLLSGAEMLSSGSSSQEQDYSSGSPVDEQGIFAAKILGNTEDIWQDIFQKQLSKNYHPPGMVIFSEGTESACGFAQSAIGPFYCPLDRKVYIDLSFFQQMQQQFGAGGDFAYAYVLAHEVGHHVENELGILREVQNQQRAAGQADANRLSVRLELMADCLAGVWAHHSNIRYRSLDSGDIEDALRTAEAIGDDMLQKRSQGYIVPDSFTHGTSKQRMEWLSVGLKSGQVNSCNTFAP